MFYLNFSLSFISCYVWNAGTCVASQSPDIKFDDKDAAKRMSKVLELVKILAGLEIKACGAIW